MAEQIQILYVDDEPDLLELGKIFLELLGDFSVTTITDANKAFEQIDSQLFDIIISDYQMPEVNGIEFLKKVRNSGNSIPFILFTGRGREEIVIQALNEGADFYLQKGGDPKSQFTELAHKIRQAVKQRKLEKSIRNHEQREADILNFLPDATFAIDRDGIIIAWNQAMEKMTDIPSEEILGKGNYAYSIPFYQVQRPMLINLILNDDPDIRLKYPWVKREGDHLSSEITLPVFHNRKGPSFWFTASPLYDNQGTIIGAIESIREITEIKRSEDALRLDESRLEALLKLNLMIGESEFTITHYALEEAVRLTESKIGYIAFVNEDESVLTMHAWSKDAMDECKVWEKPLVYPLPATGLWGEPVRQRKPVITNDYEANNPLKKGVPEGHVTLIRHLGVPVFDGDHIVAVVGVGNKQEIYSPSDIRQLELLIGGMWTIIQRKKAELTLIQKHVELQAAYEEIYSADEELRKNLDKLVQKSRELEEREHQLHGITAYIPGVVFRLNVHPDGTTGFSYLSERCFEILGIDNNLVTFSEELTSHIIPEDRERFLISIEKSISNKKIWEFEGKFIKPSGEKLWLRAVSNPVIEDDRYIFDGIIFDDTAWKQLYQFNKLSSFILDNTPVSIIIADFDGTILYANKETFRLYGYLKEEFLSKKIQDIYTPEIKRSIEEQIRLLQRNEFLKTDIECLHKNGSDSLVHVWVKVTEWEDKIVQLHIAAEIIDHSQVKRSVR